MCGKRWGMVGVIALLTLLVFSIGNAEEPKAESAKKIVVKFQEGTDTDYFKNITPENIAVIRYEFLGGATLGSLKEEGTNIDGVLLFDENRHKGKEVSKYGQGSYGMSFLLLPTGGYSFGIMLGEKSPPDPLYAEQLGAVYCYGLYDGGGYRFVLSVNGHKKESKALKSWVWLTKWYRMVLNIESETEVSASIIDPSSNEVLDKISYKGEPVQYLPANLSIVTEVYMKMADFMKIGRFTVEPK